MAIENIDIDKKSKSVKANLKYYQKNKKDILEKQRKYYLENKIQINKSRKLYKKNNKEIVKAWKHKEYEKHKITYSKSSKEWRENHKDYCVKYNKKYQIKQMLARSDYVRTSASKRQKKYRINHPEKSCGHNLRRIVRMNAARSDVPEPMQITIETLGFIWEKWLNKCAYCMTDSDITIDHVVPISKAGKHSTDNVVPACRSCNASKNMKTVQEWINKLPVLTSMNSGLIYIESFTEIE